MTHINRTSIRQWTRKQAVLLALVCLMVGIAAGWFIPRSQNESHPTTFGAVAKVANPASTGTSPPSQVKSPAQLKEMADAQAAPLLNKLKSDPNSPDLMVNIGNLYYDAQQYPIAVDYYRRALKVKPSDVAVRTDMATAHWYMGNADLAIAEFNKALTYAPNNPNTLFNLGLVKWQGKRDAAGALSDWEKLLKADPKYAGRVKVEEMIATVKKDSAAGAGIQAK